MGAQERIQMKIFYGLAVGLALVLLSASVAAAEEIGGKEARIEAIQDKMYHCYHELDFDLSYIPDDDFFQPFPISMGYTYHYNDLYGINVRGGYVYNRDRQLKKDLEDDFGVTASEFKKIQYMAHIHGVYTPLYGKDAFLNKTIINHETYLMAGVGMVNYKSDFTFGPSDTSTAVSASVIVGKKVFLNEKFCLNFEIRDMLNFSDGETTNHFWFGVSLGYRFNLSPRKSRNAEAIESLGRYLEQND